MIKHVVEKILVARHHQSALFAVAPALKVVKAMLAEGARARAFTRLVMAGHTARQLAN